MAARVANTMDASEIVAAALKYAASRGAAKDTIPPADLNTKRLREAAEEGSKRTKISSDIAQLPISGLWERIKVDPSYFEGYTMLIKLLRKTEGRTNELKLAYEMLLTEFPLCYGYWIRLATLENNSWEETKTILEKACKFVPGNPHLWSAYLEEHLDKDAKNISSIRAVIDRALESCGYHWSSFGLWKLCLDFEEGMLKTAGADETIPHELRQSLEAEAISRLRKMYSEVLGRPIAKLTAGWDKFKGLLGMGGVQGIVALDPTDLLLPHELPAFQTFVLANYSDGTPAPVETSKVPQTVGEKASELIDITVELPEMGKIPFKVSELATMRQVLEASMLEVERRTLKACEEDFERTPEKYAGKYGEKQGMKNSERNMGKYGKNNEPSTKHSEKDGEKYEKNRDKNSDKYDKNSDKYGKNSEKYDKDSEKYGKNNEHRSENDENAKPSSKHDPNRRFEDKKYDENKSKKYDENTSKKDDQIDEKINEKLKKINNESSSVDLIYEDKILPLNQTLQNLNIKPNANILYFDGSKLAQALKLSSGRAVERWFLELREKTYNKSIALREQLAYFENQIKRNYFHPLPLRSDQLTLWRQYLDYAEANLEEKHCSLIFGRALETCCNYPEFWSRFALRAESLVGSSEALKIYQYASSYFLRHRPDIRFVYAEYCEKHGDLETAETLLKEVVHGEKAVAPGLVEGYVRLIGLHRRGGRKKKCQKIFEECSELLSGFPLERSRIIMEYAHFTHIHLKDLPKAIMMLEEEWAKHQNISILKYYISLLKLSPDFDPKRIALIYDQALLTSKMSLVSQWMIWKDFVFFAERESPDINQISDVKARMNAFLKKNAAYLESTSRKCMSAQETQAEWQKMYGATYAHQDPSNAYYYYQGVQQ